MKKIYFALLSLASCFAVTAQNADLTFDQTWVPGTIYTTLEPAGWISSNALTAPLITFPLPNTNPATVAQSTSLFASSPNAARIITKKVTPGIAAQFGFGDTTGFMTTGKLVGLSSISFGYSYAVKSAQLDFQYNYQPAATTDRGVVSVIFLKRNGANRDTIATGYTVLTASPTTTAFQTGTVLMVYKNTLGSNPDTAIIGAAASIGSAKTLLGPLNIISPPAAINSTLTIDDLSFSGTVGLPKVPTEEKYVRVNYNPQTQILDIYSAGAYLGTTKINIYDITGKKMGSKSIINSNQKIDLKDLQQGLYLFSVADANDRVIKSGKFSVVN
jgi:hypothetical protein